MPDPASASHTSGGQTTPLTISFAMWTYNGAKYLPEQLASLSLQHRPPDEVVISDDASSDDTVAIARDFARSVSFPVRVVTNSRNLGPSYNFAQAISLCKGDIIAPLGQDDIQYPEKLSRIEAAFQTHPSTGLCFSDADLIDDHSQPLGETLWQRIRFTGQEQRKVAAGAILPVLIRHNVVSGPTLAFRSEYRDFILPIPDGWWEDYWIALIVGSMADVAMIPRSLVQYRLHPGQQLGLPRGPYIFNRIYAQWMAEFWSKARVPISQRLPATRLELALRHIDDMIEHYRIRATLPARRFHRAPLIGRELLRRRYERYSYGWASALSDLTHPSQTMGMLRRLFSQRTPLRHVGRQLYGFHD